MMAAVSVEADEGKRNAYCSLFCLYTPTWRGEVGRPANYRGIEGFQSSSRLMQVTVYFLDIYET